MQPSDLVLIAMLLCLGVGVGCIIFAVVKGFKIDEGKHRGMFITVCSTVVVGLILGASFVWLIAK